MWHFISYIIHRFYNKETIFITAATQNNEIDLDKFKSQLPDGILPEGFNSSSLPSADDAKKLFKEKCEKTAQNDEAFQHAENATEVFKECLMGLVDLETLQKEIDAAQPNGDLDTVFNKWVHMQFKAITKLMSQLSNRYCRKRTIAIDCMKNFTVAIEPCLNKKEVDNKKTFVNIFTNLLNFVCHKDGDQIALFIAEKGPECFNNKKDALIHCINSTMSAYIPKETPTLDDLPQLVMGVQQCK